MPETARFIRPIRLIRLIRPIGLLSALALAVLPPAAAAPVTPGRGGVSAIVRAEGRADAASPALERRVRAAIAAWEAGPGKRAAPAGAETARFAYAFFPHAGVLGRDIFLGYFGDLDPSSGTRDWDCTGYTYDGHRGQDSVLRSFREQAIGVPVFAALDGTVVEAHDGEPDMNTEMENVPANYVILDHGSGTYGLYYHFRRGSVAVRRGQRVAAGAQIGLTGSSGISALPHLHFGTMRDGTWVEPSAGRCRAGESLWADQPPVMRDLYVVDFRLAAGRLPEDDIRTVLLDATPRTATFLTGRREVGVAVDLHNLPGGSSWRLRVMKPDGTVEVDTAGSWGYSGLSRLVYGRFWFESGLDTPGTWRVVFDNNGQNLVDAPFRVVSRPAEMVNRPPHRVGVSVESIPAPGGEILVCRVDTSLIDEDPDYDIVGYRYQWRVNRKVVRGLTSAALSDALPRPRGSRGSVSCRVTPVDGGRRGTSSRATAPKSTVGE